MRTMLNVRSRPAQMAVGAALLAVPASAMALSTQPNTSAAPPNTPGALSFTLERNPIRYGQRVTVRGRAPVGDSGQRLLLEFARAGAGWAIVASTRVGPGGRFHLSVPLRESGELRIVVATGDVNAAPAVTGAVAGPSGPAGPGPIPPSAPRRVGVAAKFNVRATSMNALGGQRVAVRGRLLPAGPGRLVRLQARAGGHWNTIGVAHTRANGRFEVRYGAGNTGRQRLRMRFRGDRRNNGTQSPAGSLTVYRQSLASWYDDAGSTACGFHAYFGVASKDLPCGTQVTFSYGGHTVTAAVDDRGPYVGGREWDLNQNTAGALGFGGVDTVWSSI